MKLVDVPAGRRFQTNYAKKVGSVVGHGNMGTRVKWESEARTVRIARKPKWGETGEAKVAEFTAPAKPEIISSGVEVTILEG